MNVEVRRLVKQHVERKAYVVYAGTSRVGVSVVIMRVRFGGQVYEALGTAKWQRPDVFDPQQGLDLAKSRAIVELVDRVLDPGRREVSIRYA